MVLITVPIQIVWNIPDSSFTTSMQTDEFTCRVVMVLGDYGNYLSGSESNVDEMNASYQNETKLKVSA